MRQKLVLLLGFLVFYFSPCFSSTETKDVKISVPEGQDNKGVVVHIQNTNTNAANPVFTNKPQCTTQAGSFSESSSFSTSISKSWSQSTVISSITTSIQTHVETFIRTIQEQCTTQNIQTIKKRAQQQLLDIKKSTLGYIQSYKYEFAAAAFGLCYGTVLYKLFYYSYHIIRDDTWSSWRNDLSLELLRIIPEQELGKELVFAAQQKYQKPDTITDLLSPLIFFLRDVDSEMQKMIYFIRFYTILKRLHLIDLFPCHEKTIRRAEEKYARLLYLKNVFIRWVTDYRLAIDSKKYNEAS